MRDVVLVSDGVMDSVSVSPSVGVLDTVSDGVADMDVDMVDVELELSVIDMDCVSEDSVVGVWLGDADNVADKVTEVVRLKDGENEGLGVAEGVLDALCV